MSEPAPAVASPASTPVLAQRPAGRRDWRADAPRLLGLGLAIALGLWVLAPLFQSVWFASHESLGQVPSNRYWVRLFEFVRCLRDWQLYPRWSPDIHRGYGGPQFVFRSSAVFYLASPFVFLGATYALALKLAVVVASATGAAGAYLLVFGETERADASLVAAAAWVYAPYRFFDLYVRGDLTEYMAVCLFPLVLWLYRELGRAPREKLARTAALAALAHAALIYSHTVEAAWATELLFLMVLPAFFRSWLGGNTRRALTLAVTFAFALGLAAAYLVPAYHYRYVYGDYFDPYYVAAAHLVPIEYFFRFDFFAFVGDGMLGSPNRIPCSIGIPTAVALALGLGALAWRQRASGGLVLWVLMVVGLMWVMTPASMSLWPVRATNAGGILPFAHSTQFPWRLIGLLAGFAAGLVGVCWAAIIQGPTLRWLLCVAAVGWIVSDGQRFVQTRALNGNPAMSVEGVRSVSDLTLDYPLPDPNPPPVRPPSLEVSSPGIQARVAERRSTEYDVSIEAQGPGTVEVQVYRFPCWTIAEQLGPGEVTLGDSPAGLLLLTLPRAGTYTLKIAFRPTFVIWSAELLTLLSLVLLWPVMRRIARPRAT